MCKSKIHKILLITLSLLIFQLKMVLSEEVNQGDLSDKNIKQIVKEALREDDQEREKNRAQLASTLKSKLNLAVHEWIYQAEKKKEPELNKFSHQIWEIVERITFPVPYNYYLRGYEYIITKEDLKTDPLIPSYKAEVTISEKQFIEKYHSEDASDASEYFYTVIKPIKLNLEYQQDKFIITDTQYMPVIIKRGWIS